MKTTRDAGWTRRGLSLLWDAEALSKVVNPSAVVSVRQLFGIANSWPEELPGVDGNALVVAGVEGCLDALSGEDAETWLQDDLKSLLLSFQEEYEGQAALILWLPSGRKRIQMSRAREEYSWRPAGSQAAALPLGRCLWGGAESDVSRILVSDDPEADSDGDAWVGLFHPRIS